MNLSLQATAVAARRLTKKGHEWSRANPFAPQNRASRGDSLRGTSVSVAAMVALVLLSRPAPTHAENSQLWSDTRFTERWTDDVSLFGSLGLRWDDNAPRLARFSLQTGFDIRAMEYLTVSPTYQFIANEPFEGLRGDEHRFGLASALTQPLGSLLLREGLRLEYRHRDTGGDDWQLRPSLNLSHPLGPDSWRLEAYASAELFIVLEENEWTRTRVFTGLRKTLSESASLDLFCGREWNRGEQTSNIFGLSVRLLFDQRDRHSQRHRNQVEGLMDSPQ